MNALTRTLAVLLPVVMLWGCSTTGTSTDGDGDGMASTGETATAKVEVRGHEDASEFRGSPLDDPNSLLSQRTVYFDFDRSEIKSDARRIIEAHAQHLAASGARIVLEGHCDERGTREYNLGLGERRAKAVQQMLILLGVSSSQIEMVSYGEERPAAMGHDERSWAMNRRVEFVYN